MILISLDYYAAMLVLSIVLIGILYSFAYLYDFIKQHCLYYITCLAILIFEGSCQGLLFLDFSEKVGRHK